MEGIIYITILLTGIVFGSFFTLAVYRIPRHENIVYGRSHCTSCNHKLGFWDLIPVLSYLFLGGKCRYCGEKIRIRYLLLEILSGIVFLGIAYTHGIDNLIELIFLYLFIAGMFIIGGIDKEKYIIPNSLCVYEFLIAILHFLYVAFTKHLVVTYLLGALVIPFCLFLVNKLVMMQKKEERTAPIGDGDINYLFVIGLMLGFPIQILSVVLSLLLGAFGIIIHRYKEIPWGYYLSIATLVMMMIEPYIGEWIELLGF